MCQLCIPGHLLATKSCLPQTWRQSLKAHVHLFDVLDVLTLVLYLNITQLDLSQEFEKTVYIQCVCT
jgi:hypothetical protein